MQIVLGNQYVDVDKNFALYNELKKPFLEAAITDALKFEKLYHNCENIDNALKQFQEKLLNTINDRIEFCCKILFKYNIYSVTDKDFFERYYDRYLDIESIVSPVFNKIDEIAEYSEELQQALDLRKESRGHWEGGGFGVTGAVKGAVAASAMNAAGGIFHGIGDMFRSASNDSKISRLKKDLYNDPKTVCSLCLGLFVSCSSCFYGLRDELEKNNILSPIRFQSVEAKAIKENALKYSNDNASLRQLLIKSLCMDPYSDSIYEELYLRYPNTDGLDAFAEYFGTNIEYEFKQTLILHQKLREISALSESTLEKQCQKLKEYIKLKNDNDDVKKEIEKLSTDIVNRCGNDIDKIGKAINLINQIFDKDDLCKVKPTLQTLNLKRIKNINEDSLESIISKIQKYVIYSLEFLDDKSSEICELIKKAVECCNTQENLCHLEKTLNELSTDQMPQIAIAISAIKIKQVMLKNEEDKDFSTIYVFSPELLDIINKARNGNPIYQQWISNMFFPEAQFDSIRNMSLSDSGTNSNDFEDIKTLYTEVISYLFDQPQKHSFDLFMRLKLSYIHLDDITEYIESMRSFSGNTDCLVGAYEYAKFEYKNSNKEVAYKEMREAAINGFIPAIRFLRNVDTDTDSLFYDILLIPSESYHNLYNCEENFPNMFFEKNLRYIYNQISGNKSYYWKRESFASQFFDIWNEFEPYENQEDYSINSLPSCLNPYAMLSKIQLFSYQKTSTWKTTAYLLTECDLYCAKDNKVYHYPFEKGLPDILNTDFKNKSTHDCMLWQFWAIAYYSCKSYTGDLPINVLEKMAFCGHPLAICNLLSNTDYELSNIKKEIWLKIKEKWSSENWYFAVCPKCYNECTVEDRFCSDCGTDIQCFQNEYVNYYCSGETLTEQSKYIHKDITKDQYMNLAIQIVESCNGRKPEAILKFREVTGIGLKEAKEFIDSVSQGDFSYSADSIENAQAQHSENESDYRSILTNPTVSPQKTENGVLSITIKSSINPLALANGSTYRFLIDSKDVITLITGKGDTTTKIELPCGNHTVSLSVYGWEDKEMKKPIHIVETQNFKIFNGKTTCFEANRPGLFNSQTLKIN